MLSNDRCAPITTAGHPDVTCARCDGYVITLEAMSVGLIMSTNMISYFEAMLQWVLHLFNT